MKRYAAGAILLVIAWGLFIALLGMEDVVFFKHTVAGAAPWIVVFYIIASSGLTAYRKNQDIRGHVGYVALFIWMLACVAVNRLCGHEQIGLRLAGITFFGFAVADVALGFLIPVRWIGGDEWGRRNKDRAAP